MAIPRQQHFFLQEHLHRQVFHGGIGNVDAEKVLLAKGYKPVLFPGWNDLSLRSKLNRFLYLVKVFFLIPAGSMLVFQYPVLPYVHRLLLKVMAFKKDIRLVCFIADIDGLKDGDPQLLKRQIAALNRYTWFIVHSQPMQDWLQQQVLHSIIEQIEFFDFLTTPIVKHKSSSHTVVFAGNLEKSGFLHHLGALQQQSPDLTFLLYGPGWKKTMDQPNVVYKGTLEPYLLPGALEGSYGLVWDGESVEDCTGSLGDYMAYISHHKLSLYLVAGIPVITAKKAASAYLVAQYQVGYAVNSLSEIEALINRTDENTYRQMVQNTRALAERISQGKCLGEAIDRLEKRMDAE
jgi:glycosyltransferase involved in cell wall biosynthesis